MSRPPSLVLLAAGGTGGHLFPAQALAEELSRRGVAIELATDERAAGYAKQFPSRAIHALPAATPSGGSPLSKLGAILTLARGVLRARALIGALRPQAVVGFGGYPSVPPMLAASMLGVTTVLHEQNGVLGRANRFLAKRATAIATGFRDVRGLEGALVAKQNYVGNPVRPAVIVAAATPFESPTPGGQLKLLIFGGSQGARVMSDVTPAALSSLAPELRARLQVTQQARQEDLERVRQSYAEAGVEAVVEPFFSDLPQRLADSHLVISRAGASTVAELGVIGRPSFLVPLPGALDQDQAANAKMLADAGAARIVPQADFTPRRFAQEIEALLADSIWLTDAAAAAKSVGASDAAAQLAALVGRVAKLPEFTES